MCSLVSTLPDWGFESAARASLLPFSRVACALRRSLGPLVCLQISAVSAKGIQVELSGLLPIAPCRTEAPPPTSLPELRFGASMILSGAASAPRFLRLSGTLNPSCTVMQDGPPAAAWKDTLGAADNRTERRSRVALSREPDAEPVSGPAC